MTATLLPIPDEGMSGYLCHACGSQLWFIHGRGLLWCGRCEHWRRVPTHLALIMESPPLGYHWPER